MQTSTQLRRVREWLVNGVAAGSRGNGVSGRDALLRSPVRPDPNETAAYETEAERITFGATKANGDCLFEALARIANTKRPGAVPEDVRTMRRQFAETLRAEDRDQFAQFYSAGCKDYEWIASIASLGALRSAMCISALDSGGNAAKCIWGDELTAGRLARLLNADLLIVNELDGGFARFLHVRADESGPISTDYHTYSLLFLSRRSHYQIVRVDRREVFELREFPRWARKRWPNLPVTDAEIMPIPRGFDVAAVQSDVKAKPNAEQSSLCAIQQICQMRWNRHNRAEFLVKWKDSPGMGRVSDIAVNLQTNRMVASRQPMPTIDFTETARTIATAPVRRVPLKFDSMQPNTDDNGWVRCERCGIEDCESNFVACDDARCWVEHTHMGCTATTHAGVQLPKLENTVNVALFTPFYCDANTGHQQCAFRSHFCEPEVASNPSPFGACEQQGLFWRMPFRLLTDTIQCLQSGPATPLPKTLYGRQNAAQKPKSEQSKAVQPRKAKPTRRARRTAAPSRVQAANGIETAAKVVVPPKQPPPFRAPPPPIPRLEPPPLVQPPGPQLTALPPANPIRPKRVKTRLTPPRAALPAPQSAPLPPPPPPPPPPARPKTAAPQAALPATNGAARKTRNAGPALATASNSKASQPQAAVQPAPKISTPTTSLKQPATATTVTTQIHTPMPSAAISPPQKSTDGIANGVQTGCATAPFKARRSGNKESPSERAKNQQKRRRTGSLVMTNGGEVEATKLVEQAKSRAERAARRGQRFEVSRASDTPKPRAKRKAEPSDSSSNAGPSKRQRRCSATAPPTSRFVSDQTQAPATPNSTVSTPSPPQSRKLPLQLRTTDATREPPIRPIASPDGPRPSASPIQHSVITGKAENRPWKRKTRKVSATAGRNGSGTRGT